MSAHHAIAFGKHQSRSAVPILFLCLVVVPIGALLGALIAINNIILAGALLIAVSVPIAIFAPHTLFWTTVVGSLVLVGLIEIYLPSLFPLRYVFPATGTLFLLATLVRRHGPTSQNQSTVSPITIASGIFLAACACSQVVNWHGIGKALPGIKDYMQAWPLLFGMALMPAWKNFDRHLPKALLFIALAQLPFALHQFLFLVPLRMIGGIAAPVDIVSGTLGGSVDGGGQNAFLALVLSSTTGVLLALWRNAALEARWLLCLLPPLLLPLLLNSSRAAAIYAVIVFMLVFRRELFRRPLRVLAGLLGLVVAGGALLLSYAALDKMMHGSRYSSIGDMVEDVVSKQTDDEHGYGSYALNRTTAIAFWYSEQRHYPLVRTLLGNGLSQAKEGVGKLLDNTGSLAYRKYPNMGIGLTTVSSLLWDVGIIGTMSAFGLLLAAFIQAGRLARAHRSCPYHAGLFEGLQAATVLIALSFFHKSSFVFHLGYQMFLLMTLGFLCYSSRWVPSPKARPDSESVGIARTG